MMDVFTSREEGGRERDVGVRPIALKSVELCDWHFLFFSRNA